MGTLHVTMDSSSRRVHPTIPGSPPTSRRRIRDLRSPTCMRPTPVSRCPPRVLPYVPEFTGALSESRGRSIRFLPHQPGEPDGERLSGAVPARVDARARTGPGTRGPDAVLADRLGIGGEDGASRSGRARQWGRPSSAAGEGDVYDESTLASLKIALARDRRGMRPTSRIAGPPADF